MKTHEQIISDYKINVNQYIGSALVKNEVLRCLVYDTYGNSSIASATELNIFIDLFSIIRGLYSEHNMIVVDNITDISADIINMCAHYRKFFKYMLGVDTKIFLINSLNICDINRKFVAEYNSTFINKMNKTETTKMIDTNMQLLKILCPYLPGIYYIDSMQQFESAVIIAYIIETFCQNTPNLIISHDIYCMQLCAQYKWTSYLYPKKKWINRQYTDSSWMLPVNDKEGFREKFWYNYAITKNKDLSVVENLCEISPINFPLYLAIAGCTERSLSTIGKCGVPVNIIKSFVGSEDIKIQPIQIISDEKLAKKRPVALIESRYKAMDVQFMLPIYKNSPEAKQIQLLDLEDTETVNNISAKYYSNNPLNLLDL